MAQTHEQAPFLMELYVGCKTRQKIAAGAGGSLLPKHLAVTRVQGFLFQEVRVWLSHFLVNVHQEFRYCWDLGNNHDSASLSCDLNETCREAWQ
jgi:hypothetical protein